MKNKAKILKGPLYVCVGPYVIEEYNFPRTPARLRLFNRPFAPRTARRIANDILNSCRIVEKKNRVFRKAKKNGK